VTTIRAAVPEDEKVLVALMNHLADFPVPLWRTREEIARADRPMLLSALNEPSPETVIMVAEESDDRVSGYVFVSTHYDFFTGQPHAHIEVVVVAPAFRGQGIGPMLVAEAEQWATRRGYDRVTLNVFSSNSLAKNLYERLGYSAETVHYLKELPTP
jgi:ribosomal protein S18 acetylase RimI-like enzyme